MVYLDTSVLVKLYIKEPFSKEASDWIVENNEALPLTIFHELEFTNAVKLKQHRKELNNTEADAVLERFKRHESERIFYRPRIRWSDAFARSLELSKYHTESIGSRSLDVIHVAVALSIKAERIFTFDEKQSQLASRAGLKIIDCFQSHPDSNP